MRSLSLTLLFVFAFCIPFSHSFAGENHPTEEDIRYQIEARENLRPYWEHRRPVYPHPYFYPYPYPYYPYPPPPYWRHEEYMESPYDNLSVKQAGRITIVVQPLDAEVFVDGFQLRRKDDLTYEVGLLTGIHKVEVKREGYQHQSIDVLVEAGKLVPLTIELKKAK